MRSLFTFLSLSVLLFATGKSVRGQNVASEFATGDAGFRELMEAGLKYPAGAIDSCTMGVFKADLIIDESGTVKSYMINNSLGNPVDQAVIDFLNSTAGLWKTGVERKVPLSIAFKISYEEHIDGDYKVVGHHFKGTTSVCGSNKDHEANFKRLMKAGDKVGAKAEAEELLRRDPENPLYEQYLSLVE